MIEKRLSNDNNVAAVNETRRIEGYALVWDTPSTGLSSFIEVIKRGALDGVIEKSDVVMTMDHNPTRGILARSTNGQGSLKLEIDERGLKYSFDAPRTPLGDELLEGIRRGDIRSSSFAFTVEKDSWEVRNGVKYRTIEKIKQLYDVSAVISPAYDAASVTVVDMRGAEALEALDNVKEEPAVAPDNAEQREAEEEPKEVPQQEEEAPKESENEEREESEEEKPAEDAPKDSEEPAEEQPKEEEEEEKPAEDEKRNSEPDNLYIQKSKRNAYMPKFKLISAINAIANNQPLSEEASAVNAEGRSIMANSGITPNGHFVLPCGCSDKCFQQENRDNGIFATVATQGKEAVPTDKLDILEPLRARLVLAQAGATLLTGLQGNISLPTYSGSTAYWKGEVAKADNGEGTFGEINLAPKRLTTIVEVSKQFLIQTSDSADAMLQRDIVNAIADKLEATILGNAAGTATMPAGLFNAVVADTAAPKHSDILEMEQSLEEGNVYGDFKYIASPASKALLRGTVKGGAGSGRFLMENNEIEGIGVLSTSNVVKGGLILGQWSELIIGQWGAIDLTVDAITKADEGKVRLIINSFYDCQKRRPEAIVARILKV